MQYHNRGSIIEGIGDDVLYGIVLCLAVLIPLVVMCILWYRSRSREQVIHPDSRDSVQNARERLRQQNHMPGNSTGNNQVDDGAEHAEETHNRDAEQTCPICICRPRYAIETNCGHIFCGNCMVTYWRHGRWLGSVRCPVCRQTVNILLYVFTDQEIRNPSDEREEIMQQVNSYNRRFSGEPISWLEYINDLPTLLRHCITEFFSVGGLIWMFRLRVIVCFLAALLYFVSPLDIIPEAAFGLLGFLDDFFILLLLAIYVSIIYRRFVAHRANQDAPHED